MSTMSTGLPAPSAATPLGDPELRRFIEEFVRRRVPPSDAEDVVQTVLCDALAAERVPTEREELRKWLVGIARHKVADFHRKGSRERPTDPPEQEVPPAPIEVREMARWAEEQALSTRDGAKTLDWMAREGEGEKLENIAAEENVPAARVRQRVSRMRRWMKERWAAELGAVALLALLVIAAWRWLRPDERPEALPEQPPVAPLPEAPTPLDRARALRAEAIAKCDATEWQACLDGLDEAKRLDPIGDAAPEVVDARSRAAQQLAPESTVAPRATQRPPIAPPPDNKPKRPTKGELEKEEFDKKTAPVPQQQNVVPQQQQAPPQQQQPKAPPLQQQTKPLSTSSSIDFGSGTGSTPQASTPPAPKGKK
jgi:DNA-directed RNA polymerase specialized sigma24 family protein